MQFVNEFFELVLSKDRMSASVKLRDLPLDISLEEQSFKEWLHEKKIIFGLKHEAIHSLCSNPHQCQYPVLVAEGIAPSNGSDGYIRPEFNTSEEKSISDNRNFNFKNIMNIPSVKSGQLVATIIPPTLGVSGMDVYGNSVPAKNGRPARLRPGKNILFHQNQVYATTDGQISITSNSINVFPVFEVQGDLDMEVGNIDFIGNVVIKGNVPTGYSIKAGGDIKISGLVEGAELIAGGSISISGGIAGASRGMVKAGVNIYTRYLNQAFCKAGNDIYVETSILHSTVESGGHVFAPKGQIIGGRVSANKGIEVGEIGNEHYTKTEILVGNLQSILNHEKELKKEIDEVKESLEKLHVLKNKLKGVLHSRKNLTQQEQLLLNKQQTTSLSLEKKLMLLQNEYNQLMEEYTENKDAYVKVHGTIHPNTQICFGKYRKLTQQAVKACKFVFRQGEIITIPL